MLLERLTEALARGDLPEQLAGLLAASDGDRRIAERDDGEDLHLLRHAKQLADFIEAIRTRRPATVTGQDGRRALALAQQIADRITVEMQPRKHEDTKKT